MDANPPYEKTPPKSADRIRSRLDSVQRDVGKKHTPGPLRDGLAPDARVVIASFFTAEAGRRYQQVLLQAGIMSQGTFHRRGAEISVDNSDCERAAELLKQHQLQFPDRPSRDYRRDFDFTIFGTVMGATFGAILLVGEFHGPREVTALVIFTLFGALTGSFLDRPRNRYRRTGQLQFGIGDMLVLTAIIALFFVLWRLLGGR